jgi:hypothetical protein
MSVTGETLPRDPVTTWAHAWPLPGRRPSALWQPRHRPPRSPSSALSPRCVSSNAKAKSLCLSPRRSVFTKRSPSPRSASDGESRHRSPLPKSRRRGELPTVSLLPPRPPKPGHRAAFILWMPPLFGWALSPDLAGPLVWARLESSQALAHMHSAPS